MRVAAIALVLEVLMIEIVAQIRVHRLAHMTDG